MSEKPLWLIDLIKLNSNLGFGINGVGTETRSHSFALPRQASFAIELKFSGTTVRIKVELEQANLRPTTEKASDTNYVKPVFTNAGDASIIASAIVDSLVHIIIVRPAPTTFARILLTGNASNGSDTSLDRAKVTYIR